MSKLLLHFASIYLISADNCLVIISTIEQDETPILDPFAS